MLGFLRRVYRLPTRLWALARFRLAAANGKIFLLSTPRHGNLGDQAIIIAERQLLAAAFPNREIVEVATDTLLLAMRLKMNIAMQGDFLIALHGGGNLGSLYPMEEQVHRYIIAAFSERKIFYMPQSIFFGDDEVGRAELAASQRLYAQAKQLTICERDEVSHATGKRLFPANTHRLVPDSVTAMDLNKYLHDVERRGVTFFLRADKERVIDDSIVAGLKEYLQAKDIVYTLSDTVVPRMIRSVREREREVAGRLQLAKNARLVITDRYHGVIFSVITHTPVLVFRSYDTKISSGIKWFRELPWVHYAEDMSLADMCAIIDRYTLGEEVAVAQPIDFRSRLLAVLAEIRDS